MALTKFDIRTRKPFAGGETFGDVGRYEQIDGLAHFAVDPNHPDNGVIADIGLAPRNGDGMVEFSADFRVVKPVDNDHGNGRLLLDVVNRGKELALKNINSAPDGPPDADPHPGNGFMMRHGYSLVWCGWQHDVPSAPGLFRCDVPKAQNADGSPVSGKIVIAFQPMARVDTQFLSDREHQPYPTNHLESWESVLTVQEHEDGEETVIPRERWAFARLVDGRRVPDAAHITMDGGFEAGKVYRVVYETSHAPLVGVGMLATRDIAAWLRYGKVDAVGTANPLAGAIGRAYAYGRSQSGRFLRQMLHLGLNRDESGQIVYDGMLPNVAGGKMGEFNVRFGQPSSLSNRSVNNLPPFLDRDPDGDGILAECARRGIAPKVIYANTSSEYWGGHGALAHMTPDGKADVELPDNVRSWLFCGTQHGPANLPISDTNPDTGARGTQALNYVDYRPLMRAALYHLDRWVTHGELPPADGYPNHADGSAVKADDLADWFNGVPGVEFPTHQKIMRQLDFGPDRAVPTVIPPAVGERYPAVVSAIDGDGNETGGIRLPAIEAPLATYTGWNVRHPDIGGAGQTMAPGGTVVGAAIPFAVTREERLASGDPRASIEERYASRDEYLERVRACAESLVESGYVLAEDVDVLVAQGGEVYDAIVRVPAAVAADD
jgi:hypothetical protein